MHFVNISDQFINRIAIKTCYPVLYYFRHCTQVEAYHRRTASHGLYHYYAEGFIPMYGHKQCQRVFQKFVLLLIINRAYIGYTLIKEWFYLFVKIVVAAFGN